MKPSFIHRVMQLRAQLAVLVIWGGVQFASTSFGQAVGTYLNTGANTAPWPQIDATNIVNTGTLEWFVFQPWESSDTLNVTNSGNMISYGGWDFNYSPANLGVRRPASYFVNRVSGVVSALDTTEFGTAVPSRFFVWATNILNQGQLEVGAGGWLQLTGTNLNLSRGALTVTPIEASATGSENFTNGTFSPDVTRPGFGMVSWPFLHLTGFLAVLPKSDLLPMRRLPILMPRGDSRLLPRPTWMAAPPTTEFS